MLISRWWRRASGAGFVGLGVLAGAPTDTGARPPGLYPPGVVRERIGPSRAELEIALSRAQRSPCEREGPLADWVRRHRTVQTSGMPDWGQVVNTIAGQDRRMGENLDDVRARLAQLRCEAAVNLLAETARLRKIVAPIRLTRSTAAPAPQPRPLPVKEDCRRTTGFLPYVGAQRRFWRNTGFIDATAAISTSWQRYVTDARHFTVLREQIDDIRCEVLNAVDLSAFVATSRGGSIADGSRTCVDLKAENPYSQRPPSPAAAMAVMPQGSSVEDEYRFGEATALWHRANLHILDDLQNRMLAVSCQQERLRNALRAASRTTSILDAIEQTTPGAPIRSRSPAAPTTPSNPPGDRAAPPRPERSACVAQIDKPYVSTVPDWGDASIMASLITVEIHRQRWVDTALEDLQAEVSRMRCEQRRLNDDMVELSDRLMTLRR